LGEAGKRMFDEFGAQFFALRQRGMELGIADGDNVSAC
jgi:hypothetical protein